MKKISFYFLFLFLSCHHSTDQKLTIATAANMQFAITQLTDAFTAQSQIPCEVIISSSGKLTAQITQGAPYDIFLSADLKYPQTLHQKGLTETAPITYAFGKLILWSQVENLKIDTFPNIKQLLQSKQIKHIALANPKTAPYGRAAMEVLQHFQIDQQKSSQLVYGESISQTNQFITTQAAEIGFTAQSVIHSPILKTKGQWIEIPKNLYAPINQGLVILKHDTNQIPKAKKFQDFLLSSGGQQILNTFGYQTK